MPTSATFFYNFLVHELKVEASLTLFALYADLRRYLVLCADDAPEYERRGLARSIYNDFIL